MQFVNNGGAPGSVRRLLRVKLLWMRETLPFGSDCCYLIRITAMSERGSFFRLLNAPSLNIILYWFFTPAA